MRILQQMRVGDEYKYRDLQTGRVYTAVEARQLTGPTTVRYLKSNPWDLCRSDGESS